MTMRRPGAGSVSFFPGYMAVDAFISMIWKKGVLVALQIGPFQDTAFNFDA